MHWLLVAFAGLVIFDTGFVAGAVWKAVHE
jgi:hypothetical protein